MTQSTVSDPIAWPSLPLDAWSDTSATLHRWMQIVGKVRLAQSPWISHGWHVPLYLSAMGLTTSPIPYGNRVFQIDFDFTKHWLSIYCNDGNQGGFALHPMPVASFYTRLMSELAKLDLSVTIFPKPNEVADPIRFDLDEVHRAYDSEYVNRYWQILLQADRIFKMFRARFIGKCSPVHYFWGAPDLAVTRFFGRKAPPHPGGIPNLPDRVTRDAYSHEVSSCGFWAGGGAIPYPVFYSYCYPEPVGFATQPVTPEGAFYSVEFHEFILPYDVVRQSGSPDSTLLDFLQSTYEAAADLAVWDRPALERSNRF